MNAWVDAAVYSAEVKLLKPDPRIYQIILDQLGLPANECLFVDDKTVNIEAARALGMKVVLCHDTQQTINDIQSCLAEDIDNKMRTNQIESKLNAAEDH